MSSGDVTTTGSVSDGCSSDVTLSCELPPPPDFPRLVPPPPVPAVMHEYVQGLHQTTGDCQLCTWAANNRTGAATASGEEESSVSWVPLLVGVALLSALVGAVVMVLLIRCRRCRSDAAKSDQPKETTPRPRQVGAAWGAASGATLRRPAPRPAPDPVEEDGSTSLPYSVADQDGSAVYAELNSISPAPTRGPQQLLNTYSEIDQPQRLLPDGTYENVGYVPEAAGGESAASDPSSAYYSDVSAAEVARSGRAAAAAPVLPQVEEATRRSVRRLLPPREAQDAHRPPAQVVGADVDRHGRPMFVSQPLPSRWTPPASLRGVPRGHFSDASCYEPENERFGDGSIRVVSDVHENPLVLGELSDLGRRPSGSGPRSGDSGNKSGSEPASPQQQRPLSEHHHRPLTDHQRHLFQLPVRRPRLNDHSVVHEPPHEKQVYCSEYV